MKLPRVIALLVVWLPTILLSGPRTARLEGVPVHAAPESAVSESAALQSAPTPAAGAIADPFAPVRGDAGQWRVRVSTPRSPAHDPVFRIAFAELPVLLPGSRARSHQGPRTDAAATRGNFCRRSVQRLI